jgi:putative sigma-54 modulation protein
MQINVSGQNIDITSALKSYAEEKLDRIQKHFDHVTNTNIVLNVEKGRHLAEATMHTKGAALHADAEGSDMYAAIDSLADKLHRQVMKHKEKLSDHRVSDPAKKMI